jgi:hypothetical protein
MTGDGANNTGTMTSDFCSAARSIKAAATPTAASPCDSDLGEEHNFYTWTTTEASTQDYDIWIRWQLPSDFSAFAASDAVRAYGWTQSTAGNSDVQISMYDTDGTADATDVVVSTTTTQWTLTTVDSAPGGVYTQGSYVTFRVRVIADQNQTVHAGEIIINYLRRN